MVQIVILLAGVLAASVGFPTTGVEAPIVDEEPATQRELPYQVTLTSDRPLKFNAKVVPSALQKQWRNTKGIFIDRIDNFGTIVRFPQNAKIPVVSDARDKQAYAGRENVSPSMVCTGIPGGKVVCQGISGGPFGSVPAKWNLADGLSWGQGSADCGLPGVNTKVADFISCIKQQFQHFKLTGSAWSN